MSNHQPLIDTFFAAESKYAGLAHEPPADRAQSAAKMVALAQDSGQAGDIKEFRCAAENPWEKVLLLALLKRYGIVSYRYRKQRTTSILFRVSEVFLKTKLWPIFQEIRSDLFTNFMETTEPLVASIAPRPYALTVREHEPTKGQLCENCQVEAKRQQGMDSDGSSLDRESIGRFDSNPPGQSGSD